MRAHMNFVENLPIFGALVVALTATGVHSPFLDALSVALLLARIGRTLVHIVAPLTTAWAALRFAHILYPNHLHHVDRQNYCPSTIR